MDRNSQTTCPILDSIGEGLRRTTSARHRRTIPPRAGTLPPCETCSIHDQPTPLVTVHQDRSFVKESVLNRRTRPPGTMNAGDCKRSLKGCGNPTTRLKETNHGIMSKQRGAHSGTDSHNRKNTGRSHRYETRVLVHTRNGTVAGRHACMWQSDGHARFSRTSALTFDQQEPYRSSVMSRLFLRGRSKRG